MTVETKRSHAWMRDLLAEVQQKLDEMEERVERVPSPSDEVLNPVWFRSASRLSKR